MPLKCELKSPAEIDELAGRCLLIVDPESTDRSVSKNQVVVTGLAEFPESAAPLAEVWYLANDVEGEGEGVGEGDGDELIERGETAGVSYAYSNNELFAVCEMNPGLSMQEASDCAYRRILSVLEDFPDYVVCRFWNYVHDINGHEAGKERYWGFNEGRLTAFSRLTNWEHYPAACAIGVSDRNCVYLHATRNPIEYFENPRQVSAFHYPGEYGPASPTFSRATLVSGNRIRRIYLSGTASIVGHETLHVGNLAGQLETTFENIGLLLERIAKSTGADKSAAKLTLLKVYIRNAGDYQEVRAAIERQYPGVPKRYLKGDICRKDLLVELEGLAELEADV